MASNLVFWTPELKLAAEKAVNANLAIAFLCIILPVPPIIYGTGYVLRHYHSAITGLAGILLLWSIMLLVKWAPLHLGSMWDSGACPQFGHIFVFILSFFWRCIVYFFWKLVILLQSVARAPAIALSRTVAIRSRRYDSKALSAFNVDHLCTRCQSIVRNSVIFNGAAWYITRPVENHEFYTRGELRTSAQECHLCSLVYRSLVTKIATIQRQDSKLSIRIRLASSFYERTRIVLQAVPQQSMSQPNPASEALIVEETTVDDYQSSISTGADNCELTRHAQYWIQSCRNHPLCRGIASNSLAFMPSRLLELEPRQIGVPYIRLISSEQLTRQEIGTRKTLDYVALSHCWGNADILSLSTHNLEEFYNEIMFHELPLNFQQAVQVTLSLGFHHLWIDSLCIIQNSAEDWSSEAPRMGSLYANAVCTISATASSNPHGGLYTRRGSLGDCALLADSRSVLLVRSWGRADNALEVLFREKVENSPVTTRGWTFQENILTQRVLHYAQGIVLFECNTMRASEFHGSGVPYARRLNIRADGRLHSSAVLQRLEVEDEAVQTHSERRKYAVYTRPGQKPHRDPYVDVVNVQRNMGYKNQQTKIREIQELSALLGMRGSFQLVLRSTGNHLAEKIEFHQSWYEMVEQYSTRNLTRHTDKLMAIVGVGDFIQNHTLTGRRFLAGLWSDVMVFNLLWLRDSVNPLTTRPDRSLPTWSWASVDGRITHHLKDSIQQMASTSTSHDAISSFQTHWEDITPLIDQETLRTEATLMHNYLVHNARLVLRGNLFGTDDSKVVYTFDVKVNSEDGALVVLPILRFKNTRVPSLAHAPQVHGLILQENADEKGTYQRVGYFWSAEEGVERRYRTDDRSLSTVIII
jgi:hypothetical protein